MRVAVTAAAATPSRYATPARSPAPRPRGRGKPESPCPWPRPSSAHRTRRQGRLRRRCASAPRPYDPGRRLARSGSYPGHEARPARPRTLTETTTNRSNPGTDQAQNLQKLDRPLHMRSETPVMPVMPRQNIIRLPPSPPPARATRHQGSRVETGMRDSKRLCPHQNLSRRLTLNRLQFAPPKGAAYRRAAGSRSAWCRASASAETRAYLASDRTDV